MPKIYDLNKVGVYIYYNIFGKTIPQRYYGCRTDNSELHRSEQILRKFIKAAEKMECYQLPEVVIKYVSSSRFTH